MRIRFLCGWPQDVASGSGTAVMLGGLQAALAEVGVDTDVLTPPSEPGESYRASTLARRAWNRRLATRNIWSDVDAVVGLDWDGCDLPIPAPRPHFAMLCGLMVELQRTEGGVSGRMLALQAEWERRHIACADAVIVNSRHSARIAIEAGGADPNRLITIPHGIDEEFLQVHQKSRNRSDSPTALACAKMYPRKRIPLLVEAWAEVVRVVPDAKLIVAGDGPEFEITRRRIRELDLGRSVALLGMIASRSEMIALFDACDVFVHPSIQESFGLVYLEAMARGKPVAAADMGPAPEWVGENERGLLFPPDDCDALSTALLALLKDPERSRSMGERGREFASQFRWRRAAESLQAAVQALHRP